MNETSHLRTVRKLLMECDNCHRIQLFSFGTNISDILPNEEHIVRELEKVPCIECYHEGHTLIETRDQIVRPSR